MSNNTIAPGWLSIPDAMSYSGFTETSIRAAIALKKFPTYRVNLTGKGRKQNVRIKTAHIDAWIEGREIPAEEWPQTPSPVKP